MPTIAVRISEEERKKLEERGELSKSVREELTLYLNSNRNHELLERLDKLQKENSVRAAISKEIRLINEDRRRH